MIYPTIREFNDGDDFIICERIQFVYVETKNQRQKTWDALDMFRTLAWAQTGIFEKLKDAAHWRNTIES